MEKKLIKYIRKEFELSELIKTGDSIQDVIDRLTKLDPLKYFETREFPLFNPTFEVTQYGYDGGLDIDLWVYREETDKEYEMRLVQEEKVRQTQEKLAKAKYDKEYIQYLKLKEKFGE